MEKMKKLTHVCEEAKDTSLEKLLTATKCPGWEWCLYKRPYARKPDDPGFGFFGYRYYVRMERANKTAEIVEVEYASHDPMNSFLENLAKLYNGAVANFQVSCTDTTPEGDVHAKSWMDHLKPIFDTVSKAAEDICSLSTGKEVKDEALETLLESAGCSGWKWRLMAIPSAGDPKSVRHIVHLTQRTGEKESVDLDYDPQNSANSFIESITKLFDAIFAEYMKSGTCKVKWRMQKYRDLLTEIYDAATELNCQLPGKIIDVGAKVIRTIGKQIWVTNAELEYIRKEGCLPGNLDAELYDEAEAEGECDCDISLLIASDGHVEVIKDWDYVPRSEIREGGNQ